MPTVANILDRAADGQRLTPEEGLRLLQEADLHDLARAAVAVRKRLHREAIATYVADRNVNYTNICVTNCAFCAFCRCPDDADGYVLTREELYAKLQELVDVGGTQVLLQGGHHPQLSIEWYEELLRDIRTRFPRLHIHGFSPSEIVHVARVAQLPVREVLARFKEAGLGSLPGGGAEILVDRVRKQISPAKISSDQWLDVYRQAQAIGLKGSTTMVIGHVETPAERIEHLERLRRLQDETGGANGVWVAFIVWTMQPRNTRLENTVQPVGPAEYLRMLALARLYLDNIPNMQASWPTQGAKIGQLSFLFGANDWGGLMMEENVLSQAGTVYQTAVEELRGLTKELGLELRRRDFFYNEI